MKKKLAALLAALLLTFSLVPARALAAREPDPAPPPAVTEPAGPGTPEEPDDPDNPEPSRPPVRPCTAPPPEEPEKDNH